MRELRVISLEEFLDEVDELLPAEQRPAEFVADDPDELALEDEDGES